MDSDEFMTEQNQTFDTGGAATGTVGAGEKRPGDEEAVKEKKTVSELPAGELLGQKGPTELDGDEKFVH